jgi:3-deoxy-7-phosphoheptulonate synthase
VVTTAGNPDTHVILRGGRGGPNYEPSHVAKALDLITGAGLPRRLMVDASHGNSGKDHRRQPLVTAAIAEQLAAGEPGLTGVMLESFLAPGRQEPGPPATLTYGQSVTDACMDTDTTAAVLDGLAAAVRSRVSLIPNEAVGQAGGVSGITVRSGLSTKARSRTSNLGLGAGLAATGVPT